MRTFFTSFLAILIILLGCTPCGSHGSHFQENGKTSVRTISSTEGSHHGPGTEQGEALPCTPFCACSCSTATLPPPAESWQLQDMLFCSPKPKTLFSSSISSEIYLPIWQPPKIAS